jgi:hypothetical protein
MKEKAGAVADQTRQGAGEVAQAATERAAEVKDETVRQARDLLGEARGHISREAGEQHRNLVTNLRSLSSELGSLVDRSEQRGPATDIVAQARERMDGVVDWLDRREPGELVNELRDLARRRPGTFLIAALGAGVLAGRLTRGAVDAHTDGGRSASDGRHAAAQAPAGGVPAPATPEPGRPGTDAVGPGGAGTGRYGENGVAL